MNNTNSRRRNSQNNGRDPHFYHLADEIYRLGYDHGFSDRSLEYDNDYGQRDYDQYMDNHEGYYSHGRGEEFYELNQPHDAQGRFKKDNYSRNGYYDNHGDSNQTGLSSNNQVREDNKISSSPNSNTNSRRGFASISKSRRNEIARKGGKASNRSMGD